MTFGSLFAGIGGFDLGFERAGMRCVWQVEIDDYCRRVLAKHWPDVPRWDDVRTFTGEGFERPDVICGGFPCQDISYAGKGRGLQGKRSGLWYEYARIVSEMGPRFVAVENVAALTVRGLDAVLGTFADMGFDAEWGVIPASAFGSPQYRERLFLLAYSERNGGNADSARGITGPLFRTQTAACRERAAKTVDARSGSQGLPSRSDSVDSRGDDRFHSRIAPGCFLDTGITNPTWCEWLMGFPTDWTDLKDSETPSSPKSPNGSDAA